MDIWSILGIEQTKDKELIKNAYRERLVSVNPEENQKGFMMLRQAYEEALKSADKTEEAKEDGHKWPDTPIGNWMAKADGLYKDIQLRGNEEKWQQLLEEDVCFSLETKTQVRDELLKYFMEHNYLPQKIWKILDNKFLLREYKEELYEKFPVNYIDQGVIGNIENEEFISIEYLESQGGTDYDEFLRGCYELSRIISAGKTEEAEEKINRLEGMRIYHPYMDVFRVRYFLQKSEFDKAKHISDFLMDRLPEDIEVLRAKADVCCVESEFEKAKGLYEKVLKQCPDYYSAKISMGNICFKLKQYQEAKKYFDDAYDMHKSDYLAESIMNCIIEIEKIYEKKWKENPNELENAIELARTYYQQGKFDKSLSLLMEISPDEKNRLEYIHLTGCNYMYMEQYEKALPYLKKWIEQTKALKDDGTEKRRKEINRLAASYHCMAMALAGLKRYEEADSYLELALETNYQVIDTYEERARIYFRQKRYDDVINTCDMILQYDKSSAIAHGMRAQALFEMDYYIDAKNEWEFCTQISPNNLIFYLKKIECLFYSQEFEEAKQVLNFLKENGAESNSIIMWEAVIQGEQGNKEVALKTLLDLISKEEHFINEQENGILAELYFQTARIYMNKEQNMNKAEFYIDKALNENPLYVRALNYKGHICWKAGRRQEALTYFFKVMEEKPGHYSVNGVIGEIYEEEKKFEKAIEYYTKQLKIAPNAYIYLSRGWSYACLNRFEEARADYAKSIELDPDNPILYFHMAETYSCDEKEEQSIEYYKIAVKRVDENTLPRAYRNMAIAYQRMNLYESAIETANEWWNRLKDPDAIKRMAIVYMDMGKYQEAFYQFGRYRECIKDCDQETIDKQIRCLLFMGNFHDASKMIRQEKQNNGEIQADLINLLMLKNKLNQAKWQFKKLEQDYLQKNIGFGEDLIFMYIRLELWTAKGKDVKINKNNLKRIITKLQSEVDNRKTDPGSENIDICRLAALEMGKGNYEKAMEHVQAILGHRKCLHCNHCECTDGIFIKAMLLELQGELAEAYTYYEKAAELNKRDVRIYLEYKRIKGKIKQ